MSTIHALSSPISHTTAPASRGILVNLHHRLLLPPSAAGSWSSRRGYSSRSAAIIGRGATDPAGTGRRGALAGALMAAGISLHGSASVGGSKEEEFIRKTVSSHSIVIFSKSYCPYCTRAKYVFDQLQQVPYVIELDERDDGDDIQYALNALVGRSTVPQVFVNGQHIGGSDDTVEAYENSTLQKLLSLET